MVAPSPHAQAWALRYAVVPSERRQLVARCLADQLSPFFDEQGWTVVETYGMFWMLEALAQTGRTTAALNLIREPYGRLLAQGATTWWELFTPNQTRGNSLSHAWGGSPTWFLTTHVLGGQMLGPAQWRVAPHPGGLLYARGAVPVATQVLEIDWSQVQCGDFRMTVLAPEKTTGEILLPIFSQSARVTLNGAVVWDEGPVDGHAVQMTPQGLLIASLSGGSYEIAASFECYQILLPIVAR
jgi:hypothetical protein